jgi:hypothetical protein
MECPAVSAVDMLIDRLSDLESQVASLLRFAKEAATCGDQSTFPGCLFGLPGSVVTAVGRFSTHQVCNFRVEIQFPDVAPDKVVPPSLWSALQLPDPKLPGCDGDVIWKPELLQSFSDYVRSRMAAHYDDLRRDAAKFVSHLRSTNRHDHIIIAPHKYGVDTLDTDLIAHLFDRFMSSGPLGSARVVDYTQAACGRLVVMLRGCTFDAACSSLACILREYLPETRSELLVAPVPDAVRELYRLYDVYSPDKDKVRPYVQRTLGDTNAHQVATSWLERHPKAPGARRLRSLLLSLHRSA